jgi:predicted glycosyltransferase involved in capsule biosynthesis
MLLSILVQGKNDNYGADDNGVGGVSQRLKLSLNKLADNINKLNKKDIEIVLCDWGSEQKIVTDLLTVKCPQLKCIYVSPEIGKKYSKQSDYSISHAYNVAFRHSSGEYRIFWDSDCYMRYQDMVNLYDFVSLIKESSIQDTFFWGSRYHIQRQVWNDCKDFKNIDDFLISADISKFKHDKINLDRFGGCAMALLIHKDMGHESTCWWEELPYWGWQDIELHYRLASRYRLGIDLEDQNISFFHLDHHDSKQEKFINNHYVISKYFNANDNKWGLLNESLEII